MLFYVVGLIALPLFLIFLKEPLIRKFEEHEAMFPNGLVRSLLKDSSNYSK